MTHPEGNLLLLDADSQHHRFDFHVQLQDIAGARNPLDPGEFGDVHKAFHASLQFHESPVGEQFGNPSLYIGTNRELALDVLPRVVGHLLETKRDAFLLAIHIEDLHLDLLADTQHLGGMIDATPAHVRDVQEAVHALEVDKGAEVGHVLHLSAHLVADLDGLQEELATLGTLGLDHLAAAQHDVLPLVVDLDDLELVDVAQKFVEVLGRDDVDLGTGEEGLHPDVHHQATFHHPLDLALHQAAVFKHLDDLVPVLLVGGLFLREDNHALIVLEALQEDFHFVPLLNLIVLKLGGRYDALRLVTDIDNHDLGTDVEDCSIHNGTLSEFAELRID